MGKTGRVHVERAPAKLTVSLRVTGVRPDGYHLIDAEMVTLDLADLLTFDEGHGLEVTGAELPPDNLVTRALRAVGRRALVGQREVSLPDHAEVVGSGLRLLIDAELPGRQRVDPAECVDRVERCACAERDACPNPDSYTCHMSAGHCGPYV